MKVPEIKLLQEIIYLFQVDLLLPFYPVSFVSVSLPSSSFILHTHTHTQFFFNHLRVSYMHHGPLSLPERGHLLHNHSTLINFSKFNIQLPLKTDVYFFVSKNKEMEISSAF